MTCKSIAYSWRRERDSNFQYVAASSRFYPNNSVTYRGPKKSPSLRSTPSEKVGDDYASAPLQPRSRSPEASSDLDTGAHLTSFVASCSAAIASNDAAASGSLCGVPTSNDVPRNSRGETRRLLRAGSNEDWVSDYPTVLNLNAKPRY